MFEASAIRAEGLLNLVERSEQRIGILGWTLVVKQAVVLDLLNFFFGESIEVVETRDSLLQKLQNNKSAQIESSSLHASQESGKVSKTKQENLSPEEKLSEIVNAAEGSEIAVEEKAEQWLEEADISSGSSLSVKKNWVPEEDVSFSDLEDDDNYISNRVSVPKSTEHVKTSSPRGSNDWVQLNKGPDTRGGLQKAGKSNSRDKDSEGESSNDWLTDDDFVNVAGGN